MNKVLFLSFLIISSCASRGYENLKTEVPELFPEFKAQNYIKKETVKNIVYVEKELPKEEIEKEEFEPEEYVKTDQPSSYTYFVPNNRLPGYNNFFENLERSKTTHDKAVKAILIK